MNNEEDREFHKRELLNRHRFGDKNSKFRRINALMNNCDCVQCKMEKNYVFGRAFYKRSGE